jgi:hypothetical protein
VWDRLGVGKANPLGAIVLILLGGIALGAMLTVINLIFVFLLAALYFLASWVLPERVTWPAYSLAIAGTLYVFVVSLGAPTVPLFAIVGLAPSVPIYILFAATALFVFLVQWVLPRQVDELLRIGLMAASGVYLIAFLEVLTLVQSEVGRI